MSRADFERETFRVDQHVHIFECGPEDAEQAPLATYTLTLHGPRHSLHRHGMKYVAAAIPEPYIREATENLTDLLPDGYHVEIHEWSEA